MMTKATRASNCSRFEPWLSAHLDGELDAVHVIELEDHIAGCSRCCEELALLRAMRCSIRRTTSVSPSDAFRARIAAALAEVEDERDSSLPTQPAAPAQIAEGDDDRPRLIRMRFAVPLAAAAVFALVFGAIRARTMSSDAAPVAAGLASTDATAATPAEPANLASLLEDLVTQHVDPLPPETTDPEALQRFDPFVGVRVRRPEFKPYGARYVGARVQAMRERRAAMLQYVVHDRHRVTMYVFDPRRVPVSAARAPFLRTRSMGTHAVYVGHIRGYSVAASESQGVGYALASDLGDEESAELLVVAAR